MENYQVLQQLPPGALGVNLVVMDRGTLEKLLIKQVQCMDEHHASQALEELLPVLKLHHPHVSPYRELFIIWDQKVSALFLCLVTGYSPETFQTLIDRQRDSKTVIDPEWLQEMLGQVLDGLDYLHQLGITHRNLKPSNIAFVSSHHCRLQDLSSQAMMTDKAKWTVRVDEEPLHRSWMAPEALNFTFTHKSDIWSLGCVILDLASCSFLGEEAALRLRRSIQDLPESLQEALVAMQERGVPDAKTFSTLLPRMLQSSPADRIDIREVIHATFVRGHFHSSTITTSASLQLLPSSATDTLLMGNLAKLMQNFPGRPDIQLRALKTLQTLPGSAMGAQCPTAVVDMVARVMQLHERLWGIQHGGCSLLLHLLRHGMEQEPPAPVPSSSFLISVLMNLVEHHHGDLPLLRQLYSILTIMASEERTANELQTAGLSKHILKHLARSPGHRDLCLGGLHLLWVLLVNVVLVDKVSLEEAVSLVSRVLTTFPEDLEMAESGCALLWLLSLHGCVKEDQVEQLVALLVQSIRVRQDRVVLVTNAYRGLACLAKASELAALKLMQDGGLSLIRETYESNKEDPAMMGTVCLLLLRLVAYKEVSQELASSGLEPLMQEMKERFSSSLELVAMAEEVLQRLAESCELSRREGNTP